MSDEDALLRAVLESPDDDMPRLMIADLWDETGRPERAEFCRVQCELVRLIGNVDDAEWKCLTPKLIRMHRKTPITQACGECRVCALNARQKELWEFVACAGVPIGIGSNQITLERGFVKKMECSAQAWLAHADQILAAHPVQEVTLTTPPDIKNQIESISPSHDDELLLVRHTASWGGKKIEQELAVNSEMMLAGAISVSIPAADFLRAIPEWKTVKTWHLPPAYPTWQNFTQQYTNIDHAELMARMRFAAGNMEFQPPDPGT